jgi:hypothetical protein
MAPVPPRHDGHLRPSCKPYSQVSASGALPTEQRQRHLLEDTGSASSDSGSWAPGWVLSTTSSPMLLSLRFEEAPPEALLVCHAQHGMPRAVIECRNKALSARAHAHTWAPNACHMCAVVCRPPLTNQAQTMQSQSNGG